MIPKTWDEMSREEIEKRDDDVVNNNSQYCSVVRTGIGSSSIVIGGEVDAGKPSQRSFHLLQQTKFSSRC